jgi:hypothetical protein
VTGDEAGEVGADELGHLWLVEPELGQPRQRSRHGLQRLVTFRIEFGEPTDCALNGSQLVLLLAETILRPAPQRAHRF